MPELGFKSSQNRNEWPGVFNLLRAKRASKLQGTSTFLGCIKKMFSLGCRPWGNFNEGDLIGQWLERLQSGSPVVPTNKEDERSPVIRG